MTRSWTTVERVQENLQNGASQFYCFLDGESGDKVTCVLDRTRRDVFGVITDYYYKQYLLAHSSILPFLFRCPQYTGCKKTLRLSSYNLINQRYDQLFSTRLKRAENCIYSY